MSLSNPAAAQSVPRKANPNFLSKTLLWTARSAVLTDVMPDAKKNANAIMTAAIGGDLNALRHALDAGASVNAIDAAGWTPLLRAVRHRHLKVAAELIVRGAQVKAETRNGWTALSLAVKSGYPEMITLIAAVTGP